MNTSQSEILYFDDEKENIAIEIQSNNESKMLANIFSFLDAINADLMFEGNYFNVIH